MGCDRYILSRNQNNYTLNQILRFLIKENIIVRHCFNSSFKEKILLQLYNTLFIITVFVFLLKISLIFEKRLEKILSGPHFEAFVNENFLRVVGKFFQLIHTHV